MGLKILHSADWHLDTPFTGFTDAQRSLLKKEQQELPGRIAELCRRESCDLVLLAGDIFDGSPSRDTLETVKKALRDCVVPVAIAPGNHDFCDHKSVWMTETWPENVYIFKGGLEAVTIQALDCRIYGAGFQSMDCESLLAGFEAEGEESYCVAVLHGDPMQKNSPYNPITANQVRASGLDYLALGHIHKAGAFRAGNTLCAWPGCPMGRGWDETGEKGVCIVTLEEESQIQAVSLDTIRFFEMDVPVGTDPEAALEEALPVVGTQDFYRINLTGDGPVDVKALTAAFGDFPNLELRDRTDPPVDIWADCDEDSLEGIYFGMLKKAMENDPENAHRIQLAAEISRKLLGGREVSL
ncbi:MAG: DNA repair exonuclease [Oscillospiraceae bacterium]|nr:DNA repair exonuclease [Oscillospiraceae bacterium]